jgi:hypothetical protein
MQKSVKQKIYKFLFFLFVTTSSFLLRAHDYYFAFAEVEFNEKSSKLEATLIVTAHDLELHLIKRNIINTSIEKALLDSSQVRGFMAEINNQFMIVPENQGMPSIIDSKDFSLNSQSFQLDGYNIRLDGNLELYLSKSMDSNPKKLIITFSLMMNQFPDQQNKLTFIRQSKKSTFNFTLSNFIYSLDFY